MVDNSSMTANRGSILTKLCHTFANIFDIFTCNSHNDIICIGHLLLFSAIFTNKSECRISK